MGAWIETLLPSGSYRYLESHLSWVRGLKLSYHTTRPETREVAPLMGAWIETQKTHYPEHVKSVAPLMGAWIETGSILGASRCATCRTSHGCVD